MVRQYLLLKGNIFDKYDNGSGSDHGDGDSDWSVYYISI